MSPVVTCGDDGFDDGEDSSPRPFVNSLISSPLILASLTLSSGDLPGLPGRIGLPGVPSPSSSGSTPDSFIRSSSAANQFLAISLARRLLSNSALVILSLDVVLMSP